ncbi:hypothetical protein AFERRID_07340 [Acidithiobacillus ferridurans]|uniref:Uncharacterized protein n=1 Tax=Acidithiobacillus ferridurans TaxID=1232575 RepID=A0A2Z6IGM7_ACIFI|nr:hypothetical protein AFERRID_07340 [Acidithiobacillus ferridurans]
MAMLPSKIQGQKYTSKKHSRQDFWLFTGFQWVLTLIGTSLL